MLTWGNKLPRSKRNRAKDVKWRQRTTQDICNKFWHTNMCARVPTVSDYQKPPPVYARLAFDLAYHKANWTKHQHYRLSCTATQGGHKPPLCCVQCALNVHGVQTSKVSLRSVWFVQSRLTRSNTTGTAKLSKKWLGNFSLNFELPPWTTTTLTHRQDSTNWTENRHDQQTHTHTNNIWPKGRRAKLRKKLRCHRFLQ